MLKDYSYQEYLKKINDLEERAYGKEHKENNTKRVPNHKIERVDN